MNILFNKLKPKSVFAKLFLGFLVIVSVLIILLIVINLLSSFGINLKPRKEVFATTFTTSKQTKVKLWVEETGFFFERKEYKLKFSQSADDNNTDTNCSKYINIHSDIGEEFTATYIEKVDLNKMFEFQADKVILFRELYSNLLTPEERKEKNLSDPYLVIPEKFYSDLCRI